MGGDRDDLEVDRCEVGQDAVEVGGVADVADEAGHAVGCGVDGEIVEEGMVLGHVGGMPVVSGLSGMIRGLVHPEAELSPGVKVGDVDPRGSAIDPTLVTDKALAVGGGVLEALLRLNILPGQG